MRFVCLGYYDEAWMEGKSEEELSAAMEECFAYDDELRRGGHFIGGQALQHASQAVTLRTLNGQVDVTDGPFAETKEQIGGLLFLEARDLNHAIALISRHPGIGMGPFEIRPVNEEISALIKERDAAIQ
ncbi:YCII-related domain protein [Gimesia chilikensis]|uniref:YCII-related domain protein n=1 Tax=Gimesia chilikensis TaxID=2605989 RepID=A0A517W8U3_9PLAN|nr:YciI family protein [Gimesia chilikensis]QDU01670.1 YCII-related domain protein [Gimesia chilikensis]